VSLEDAIFKNIVESKNKNVSHSDIYSHRIS